MNRILLAAFAALFAGCIVYDSDVRDPPPPNQPPYIAWAEAGCYWDGYGGDYVWYFEADVDDPNGAGDVIAVYADVYDDWSGEWIDGFELYWYDGITWFSDWWESSTWLDCYYAYNVVEFTAYDYFEAVDVVDVYPYVYE
ncbi:MAG: hypothetical protein JXB39_09260 [Deltaproteobacteria bacterium]|nr:hypothetical protein [Deltaproteobacteria bacterium]